MIHGHNIHEFVYIHKLYCIQEHEKIQITYISNCNHYTLNTANGRKHAIKNLTI